MKCPFCSHKDTKVLDSRLIKEGTSIRRRRECSGCDRRFTTYEKIEATLPKICKNDGRREDYSRQKLSTGIEIACQKLPIHPEQIENIVDSIERKLMEYNLPEVKSRVLGNLVMMYLQHLNPVAFVRFASVYKNFENIEEFVQNLKLEEENLV